MEDHNTNNGDNGGRTLLDKFLSKKQGDKGIVTYDSADPKRVLRIEYFDKAGRLHRDPEDGPAQIIYGKTELPKTVRFYWRGFKHNDLNRPSVITYAPWGQVVSETWYSYGLRHRDPKVGPAHRQYSHEGLEEVIYWVHGYLARDPREGPFWSDYDQRGGGADRYLNVEPPTAGRVPLRWLRQIHGPIPQPRGVDIKPFTTYYDYPQPPPGHRRGERRPSKKPDPA